MKRILAIGVILAALAAILGFGFIQSQWTSPGNELSKETLVEIPKGASPLKVGKILQKNQLIPNAKYFYYFCRVNPNSVSLKSGTFLIPPALSVEQVAAFLTAGKTATRKLTIPEGRASWEIFSILKKQYPHLDSLTWEKKIYDPAFTKKMGVDAPALEGYLLADTYQFPYEATMDELIQILVKATQKVIDDYKDSDSEVLANHGWHGVLTLASVVEEETGIPDERPHIAGVFYNRVKQGWPLGADPTVRFIFRNLTGPIYKSQLNSNNPYNTRKFAGLPPGPISNPGRKAIEAALSPMETKDMYFVAKYDGSKTHFFCPTLVCHNKYKDIAAKNRGE